MLTLHPYVHWSVDGLFGPKMNTFPKFLRQILAHYPSLFWIRAKISFALLCITLLRIKGNKLKWKGMDMEDGSGILP